VSKEAKAGILLKKWINIFKLSHWNIVLEFKSEKEDKEMKKDIAYALIDAPNLVAIIRINKALPEEDIELAIVHELLHVLIMERFLPIIILIDNETASVFGACDEQIVRILTKAFEEVMKK